MVKIVKGGLPPDTVMMRGTCAVCGCVVECSLGEAGWTHEGGFGSVVNYTPCPEKKCGRPIRLSRRAFAEAKRDEAEAARAGPKAMLHGLFRDDPATPEGKYLVKRRDGTVVEWPSFVLGARDRHAAFALRAYADSAATDPEMSSDFVARVRQYAAEWDAYRAAHGDGDPGRGRHRQDDPATVEEMGRGHSA